jgi:hypothetical protein
MLGETAVCYIAFVTVEQEQRVLTCRMHRALVLRERAAQQWLLCCVL